MGLVSILRSIAFHPMNRDRKWSAITRFVKWQINTRLNPYPIIYPFTKNSKLVVRKGLRSATANYYCGLYEFNDMLFLIHFLRPEDTFVDVGANVGTYSILASAHVQANTIAFEPVPSSFVNLMTNLSVNDIKNKVEAHNLAVGSKRGSVRFTSHFDTMNRMATANETDCIDVAITTLDDALLKETPPALIKIDVEGYELEVLQGARKTLESKELKAVIIELNGSGKRYGVEDSSIHELMLSIGFEPYHYDPVVRSLTMMGNFGKLNTIYIRDFEFVSNRIRLAPKVEIRNKSF